MSADVMTDEQFAAEAAKLMRSGPRALLLPGEEDFRAVTTEVAVWYFVAKMYPVDQEGDAEDAALWGDRFDALPDEVPPGLSHWTEFVFHGGATKYERRANEIRSLAAAGTMLILRRHPKYSDLEAISAANHQSRAQLVVQAEQAADAAAREASSSHPVLIIDDDADIEMTFPDRSPGPESPTSRAQEQQASGWLSLDPVSPQSRLSRQVSLQGTPWFLGGPLV